mgnify:FL=1
MNIHQLNVSHVDRQDRLLLRLNTPTGQEFRFWFTRRLTLRLLPALQQALERMEAHQTQTIAPDPASQHMLTELKRETFLQQADFQTPYAAPTQPPPQEEEPMLVTDVQLDFQTSGVQLSLQDKGAPGGLAQTCHLHLQPALMHGLIHLMTQAVAQAEWQTALSATSPAMPFEAAPTTGYRH